MRRVEIEEIGEDPDEKRKQEEAKVRATQSKFAHDLTKKEDIPKIKHFESI